MKIISEVSGDKITSTLFSDGKVHMIDSDLWTNSSPLVVEKKDLEDALKLFDVKYGMKDGKVQQLYHEDYNAT